MRWIEKTKLCPWARIKQCKCLLLLCYFMIVGCGEKQETTEKDEPPSRTVLLTDWCSFSSIDQTKTIEFHVEENQEKSVQNRILIIKEKLGDDKNESLWELEHYKETRGTWVIDENMGVVTVNIGDTSVVYRFSDPGGICILASGSDLTAVNLEASWIGDETNPLEDYQPE